ncbi:hypothetical protein B2J93_6304 [Marssonina coronariae]|uniref:Uncharacterized protein n=1 Tax=Diplocarpon coronariae TaxID=2795749 RepID=A0A218ZEF8_9HELO|nr:hypothetical protein B2J93_6304 [Marssonina coronariae]
MDPTPQAKDEDENGGLFNMDLALSNPEADNENGQGREAEKKVPRDFQSEEDFQSQLRDWRPRVERGDLYKALNLPVDSPSKPTSQNILHAIEELYFYRRYAEAKRVTEEALRGTGLVGEFRGVLEGYLERCCRKLGESVGIGQRAEKGAKEKADE